MKVDIERHMKSLITSVIMSLVINHTANAEIKQSSWPTGNDSGRFAGKLLKYLKRKFLKSVLSMRKNGSVQMIAQHGSHMSHSSHSSHSSHYSHYSSVDNAGSNSNAGTPQTPYSVESAYTSKYNEGQIISSKLAGEYKLGDRTLKKGAFGRDVDELADILIKLKLFDKQKIKKQNGYTLFDESMVLAVKGFQKSKRMRESGTVDSLTARKLLELIKKDK
jgi:murein L,D-transpeptidase YcbB/YkuD